MEERLRDTKFIVPLTGPQDRRMAHHTGPEGGQEAEDGSEGKPLGHALYWSLWEKGKERGGLVNDLGLASLNYFGGL